jgi:toluene monooxygenase system ferredoxin subunit
MMVKTADFDDLWDGEMRGYVVHGQRVLLVRLDGKFCAYQDRCAHLGVALSEGSLEAGVIVCRAHHFEYDARTGNGVNPRTVRLREYGCEVKDGAVFVDIPTEGP